MTGPAPAARRMSDIGLCVIVPTYRRPEGLGRLLRGLRPQLEGYPNRRLIVVNDGSHDQRYQAAIEPYRDIADYVVAPENGGPSAARNLGAKRAGEEYLVFIDDDCVAPPYWLDWLCAVLAENPDADAVGGMTRALKSQSPGLFEQFIAEAEYHPQPAVLEGQLVLLVSASLAVRRAAFAAVGGFDETLVTTEDRNLTYRLARNRAIFHLDFGWFVYHDMASSPRTHFRRYYRYGRDNRREIDFEQDPPDRRHWPPAKRPFFYWFARAAAKIAHARRQRAFDKYALPVRILYVALSALTLLIMDWGFARGGPALGDWPRHS